MTNSVEAELETPYKNQNKTKGETAGQSLPRGFSSEHILTLNNHFKMKPAKFK